MILTYFFSFIVAIGLMIFVHELGHFLIAKWMGIRVLTFSLGMGPKLWKIRFGDTEYAISAIPFGGYVKMAGENPDEKIIGEKWEFSTRNGWVKSAIVIAGPIMNFFLTFLIFFIILYFTGLDVPIFEIGAVFENSPAQNAGIEKGDRIVQVDDVRTEDISEISSLINNAKQGRELRIGLMRNGKFLEKMIIPEFNEAHGKYMIGVQFSQYLTTKVGHVKKNGPAYSAGIKKGDNITKINGREVSRWSDIEECLEGYVNKEANIEWERNKQIMNGKIVPTGNPLFPKDENGNYIADMGMYFEGEKKIISITESIKYASIKTINAGMFLLDLLSRYFRGKVDKDSVGGPLAILFYTGEYFQYGIFEFLSLIALISVNLGVINLMPFPVLDGGHLVLFLVEGVSRRQIDNKIKLRIQQVGIMVLFILMFLITINDIRRFATFFNVF